MKSNILHVENMTMQFGGVIAVNNLSIDVNEGEIVALIGPNGAGKTTTFNCITGVYEPTNGCVSFCGEVIARNRPRGKMKKLYAGENKDLYAKAKRRAKEEQELCDGGSEGKKTSAKVIRKTPDQITKLGIARTFQNIRLFKSMTVFENVLIAKHIRARQNVFSATFRLNYREERRAREECLALLNEQNLLPMKDDPATSLPYGLQRRLEISRALATKPKLLLLDEPAAGMNPQETQELADFIVQIKNKYNLTILLIEHHMDLVMKISDRIYVQDFGKLIAQGTPEEVQKNQHVIDAYLGVVEDA
jgi:branched-chain amino acid transport system ATP-binding protein